jgi:hypothetical protein
MEDLALGLGEIHIENIEVGFVVQSKRAVVEVRRSYRDPAIIKSPIQTGAVPTVTTPVRKQ